MMKKALAISVALMVGASASAMAASGVSGTQIGSGTLAVSGAVGESTCTVSFPNSVAIPAFSKADFQAKAMNSVITTQSAGNITFSGCDGQSVTIKVSSTDKVSGNGFQTFPVINGEEQGQFALALGLDKNGKKQYVKVNKDDTNFQNISITSSNNSIPVTVDLVKIGYNANGITYGSYNVNYVFTATYA